MLLYLCGDALSFAKDINFEIDVMSGMRKMHADLFRGHYDYHA